MSPETPPWDESGAVALDLKLADVITLIWGWGLGALEIGREDWRRVVGGRRLWGKREEARMRGGKKYMSHC
jgi:hypothetical protein